MAEAATDGMAGPHLAFDLGASNWRAVLGWKEGASVRLEEVARRRNVPYEREGGLFWDIQGIFQGMKEVLRELAGRGIQPAAVGIDSWSIDYGLLDHRGGLLETPRSYRDRRNLGMRRIVAERFGARELFRRTALMHEDITTLCQLCAAREQTPELLEQAACLLFIPDLLRFWLCGRRATDFTLATTSQLYDIHRRRWDGELLAGAGLPAGILPEVVPAPAVLAALSPEIRAETGAGAVPVTTGASHDTAAAFSTIAPEAGSAVLSSGSWSILGVHMERPEHLDAIDPERFGYEGNPDGTVRLVCNIPGMWILEQCRAAWQAAGTPVTYPEIVRGARDEAGFESRIDPYHPLLEAPREMPAAIAAYCREAGQRVPQTPFQTARAIFLGLAATCAASLREIEQITGQRVGVLHVIGGGSRNELLNELIAEAAGVEVRAGQAEATALGNILNQRRALRASGGAAGARTGATGG